MSNDSIPHGHLVVFLPWLCLRQDQAVAGVEFLSFLDSEDGVRPEFAAGAKDLTTILSS